MPSSGSRPGFVHPGAAPADDPGGASDPPQRLDRVDEQLRPPTRFSLVLPRDPCAGSLARRAVREHLGDRLAPSTLIDVLLAVSELVANAVVHGAGVIELRIAADGTSVAGQVIDQGTGFVWSKDEGGRPDDGGGGLGLLVVGRLVGTSGVHQGTAHAWFKMPVFATTEEPRGAPRGGVGPSLGG